MHDDYLMRMIHGLGGLVHWVATLGQRPPQEAQVSFEAMAASKLRALAPQVLALMTATMILTSLTMGDGRAQDTALHAAAALTDIAEEQLDAAYVREILHQRAIVLYDHGSSEDPATLLPYRAPATVSAEAIDPLPLAPDVRTSLVHVLDRLGHYARAEDHLFELAAADHVAAVRLGERLYAAWGTLPVDVLVQGGLDPSDLGLGMADLRRKT